MCANWGFRNYGPDVTKLRRTIIAINIPYVKGFNTEERFFNFGNCYSFRGA